jgi:hypothetical protein
MLGAVVTQLVNHPATRTPSDDCGQTVALSNWRHRFSLNRFVDGFARLTLGNSDGSPATEAPTANRQRVWGQSG